MDYIPIDQCKDGYLYEIDARNASIGIYQAAKKTFVISRNKFGENFLCEEDHWDYDNGTAKPLKEIVKAPDEGLLEWLNVKEKEHDVHM